MRRSKEFYDREILFVIAPGCEIFSNAIIILTYDATGETIDLYLEDKSCGDVWIWGVFRPRDCSVLEIVL